MYRRTNDEDEAMTKHTQGPWQAERDECHFGTLSTVTAGTYETRMGISQQMIVQVGGWAGTEEQEANTRLIEAAPDLLEELQDWVAQYGCSCGHPACNDCERTRSAKSVIANATGVEQ